MLVSPLRPLAAALVLLLGLAFSPVSPAQSLIDSDRDAIRGIIQAQLDAFAKDDAATAFGFATPSLQTQFGSASRFLAAVREAYAPVYRPGSVWFGALKSVEGTIAQFVHLTDRKGDSVLAVYFMERQKDGNWRIAGCRLLKDPGLDS